jgi:hypothetical protein
MKMQLAKKKSWLYFPLTASFFGLVLVIDQLLLPMFHFKGFPFKISYFLASLWFLDFLIKKKRDIYIDREFKLFCLATFIIIICGSLGELFFSIYWTVESFEPFIRSNLIYVLTVFSFGLGLASSRFDIKWLFPVILISIFLNFAFIFLKFQLPTFLIDLYYGKEVIDDFKGLGLDSVEAILELSRPRGLFPNPNGSAFLVNIISLFIYLGIKHKLCAVPSVKVYVLIILLPVVLSVLLASRGEFIVAVILAVLHFKTLKLSKKINFVVLVSVTILTTLLFSASFIQKIDTSDMKRNLERVLSIVKVIDNASSKDSDVKALSSVARPLQTLVWAYERFKVSPIFGTGYAKVQGHEYFEEGTDYLHNDWFRLMVTSGLIGLIAMLWIINRFVMFLGWPVLIPFIFPGMINTFLLNIPAVMFFFYMVGYMRSKLRHPRSLAS